MNRLYKSLLVFGVVGVAAVTIFVASHYLQGTPAEATSVTLRAPLAETDARLTSLKARTDVEEGVTAADYVMLGFTQLQATRETAEGAYADRAEKSFQKALELDAENAMAMQGMGMVAMTRHQFKDALEWGKKSVEANAYRSDALGLMVDAYTDLGQYENAVETAQKMVDMRPDLASLTRVAYLRDLHGDTEGAIKALKRAVSAGSGSLEHTNWVRVQLGDLYFRTSQMDLAEQTYRRALMQLPQYAQALAGLAKILSARGDYEKAAALYEDVVHLRPIGSYIITLADTYMLAGKEAKADSLYQEAVVVLEEEKESGMNMHEEMALLLLDLDIRKEEALDLAKLAYERRPTVNIADILAWAYFKNGQLEQAQRYSQEALRLGADNARFYYHAGHIAAEAGQDEKATRYFERALEINPHFSVGGAAQAEKRLAEYNSSS